MFGGGHIGKHIIITISSRPAVGILCPYLTCVLLSMHHLLLLLKKNENEWHWISLVLETNTGQVRKKNCSNRKTFTLLFLTINIARKGEKFCWVWSSRKIFTFRWDPYLSHEPITLKHKKLFSLVCPSNLYSSTRGSYNYMHTSSSTCFGC